MRGAFLGEEVKKDFLLVGFFCKGGAWKVISLLPLPKTLLLSAGYLQVIS